MVKFWKGTREQSENFEGNTGTCTPPGRPSVIRLFKKHLKFLITANL
jgi:hypothetical protein